jgi:L-ascorbate metabolism protein UlaG (beta-lactamase superfamily)
MDLQLLRNATMKIHYKGHTILTDPMLAAVGTLPSFAGKAPNPTCPLPLAVEEILADVDLVLVSHLHPDHFDEVAVSRLPKDLPILCSPVDLDRLCAYGFTKVTAVEERLGWHDLIISRTGGRHGSGRILERMGPVAGFVIEAEDEPTLYWVGDSIWCQQVAAVVAKLTPQVIVTHSGGATLPGTAPIIMDIKDTLRLAEDAATATVVAVHLEALDHCTVDRMALRLAAENAGINRQRLLIPNDGETFRFGPTGLPLA